MAHVKHKACVVHTLLLACGFPSCIFLLYPPSPARGPEKKGKATCANMADGRPLSPSCRVSGCRYVCAFVLYAGVAAWGYAAWGATVEPVVLNSFPQTSPLALSAQLALALVLTLSFVLQMTPVFQLAEGPRTPAPS